jgi:hypothetical protein
MVKNVLIGKNRTCRALRHRRGGRFVGLRFIFSQHGASWLTAGFGWCRGSEFGFGTLAVLVADKIIQ